MDGLLTMPQIRIPRGGHGDIVAKQLADGRWSARVQVRDIDGRIRSVRATAKTKSAATRLAERRLNERVAPSIAGITADTTFEDLCVLWLEHRKDHGKVKAKGLLAPQTLATYQTEIEQVIIPAIGQVRIQEARIPFLDRLFADVEHGRKHGSYPAREGGRSTRQLRVVLGGMLALAVAHGALPANPIRDVSTSSRQPNPEVKFLTVDQARQLRKRVNRSNMRIPERRMPNHDLEEFIDLLLGTGCREGEALAIRPVDLHDLEGPVPTVHICGTVIEPRKGFVEHLHRQNRTKTGDDRRLILPDAVAAMLRERMRRERPSTPESPIFATGTGNWISPANLRTRLRTALARISDTTDLLDMALAGTTLHTLRRTVGTLIAHEVSLDAARDQLGHRDPSVTFRHYVGQRMVAPDLRATLDQFFEAPR